MADLVKQILAKPIQLADMVIKAADEACSSKQDCGEIKSKTEKLAALLRQAARASNDLYERPTRRILDEIEQVLEKALGLVLKCRSHSIVKRVFFINLAAAFRKMHSQLENSVGNVSWLLRVSASASADECLGLPPIAANEPILCLIWEQIATLHTGPPDDASASDAAASLVSLARDNDRYGKLIIEEGGVGPLLKLLKEGKPEGQENAARAIGLLGRDPESVEQIIVAGASSVFTKVLKEGPMKVQAVVAWAVSEFAAHYPKCQDVFAQNHIIRLLVSHLAFETVQEHSKYAIVGKTTSIHSLVLASNKTANKNSTNLHNVVETTVAMKSHHHHHHQHHHYQNSLSIKSREFEDPETKSFLKSMSARALCRLAKNNHSICRSITESRALLCFAVLLEKGPADVQNNSAMAVMEITAVAEQDPDLRRSAFKPNSPSCKAIVDQLVRIIENPNSNLLIPCIVSVGNLARTFRATETRVISPLVKLLDDDEREADVAREVVVALTKFASKDNYLHMYHSKEIIGCGGANHLVQLVYLGESKVQSSALVLLCHIAMNVPDCEELARAEVLTVLEWASKQANIAAAAADDKAETLLHDAKSKLELYQSRGLRGFR
ncbi:hypothetical protein DM860_004796 [Cuscuta australis]|uniref:DUF7792 domain-containing protein n=1 Tax=Cuscuta australis TaxID=267555 RepID=A0A328DLE9_9ASTE|nr:hypothetical protein DM860_004796 [Cuscuta australis]